MKIEKLRNNHKRGIIIGTILTVVIGGALTFKLTHSKYRTTQSINLATGVINYTVPDFKIMAIKISEDGTNYSDTNSVPTSGYTLNTENSICKASDTIDSSITIEYIDGKINFWGITQKGTKCYLYFDKKISVDNVDDLIAKVQDVAKTEMPDFSTVAITDEGIYQTADDGGTTYYWRGAVEDNHILFANYCWRIIRINGDGSIKMIYNGIAQNGDTCLGNGSNAAKQLASISAYNTIKDHSYYVGWTYEADKQYSSRSINADGITIGGTPSTIKGVVESWYTTNISNKGFDSKVAIGKYRNDCNTTSGNTWVSQGSSFNYAPSTRLYYNKKPNMLEGGIYNLKVGLITADEVAFAGGVYNIENTNYYLYSGNLYWTMSPESWTSGTAYAFAVQNTGSLIRRSLKYEEGVRPVINLKSDITFSSGNGTQNTPYVVS